MEQPTYEKIERLQPSDSGHEYLKLVPEQVEDMICIGFGPASLAIAIALHDLTHISTASSQPKVSFLERQTKFGWHSGMQLPGAKMQISFLKDLATPRNPSSRFTFLNYLHSKGRLNNFINLGTFLPARMEYEDYLRWCASHFEEQGMVSYGQEVLEVVPGTKDSNGKVLQFRVISRDCQTGKVAVRTAKNVVIAVGGKPALPKEFLQGHPAVLHSSQYSTKVASALPDPKKGYNIAVVGSGQSAAEIFNDLPSRYPNAKVTMIIKGSALRPSDDSPFVNEVFDPDRVDSIFADEQQSRTNAIKMDRATNYGVVRLDLLEHLYQRQYMQRVANPDAASWPVRIVANTRVVKIQPAGTLGDKLRLSLRQVKDEKIADEDSGDLVVDAVFAATGYLRNAHLDMLKNASGLIRDSGVLRPGFPVRRDYKVDFDERKVDSDAGIWLQGCNESTHGLSDTLLSILAIRGGEVVQSIFGENMAMEKIRANL